MATTILIVDDDPDDRALTIRVLRKQGYDLRCVEFNSGVDALAHLKESNVLPALTLMDLKMPIMDGIETLQQIRADTRTSRLPVVIVTNSTLESDRDSAMSAGADDVIVKDIVLARYASEIGARLKRWIL